MDMVNTAVRFLVLAFVFIGGAITLAGPQLVTGNNVDAPDKPAATAPKTSKLTTSAKKSARQKPEVTI